MSPIEHAEAQIRRHLEGAACIVAVGPPHDGRPLIEALTGCGAGRVLWLGSAADAGRVPAGVEFAALDLPSGLVEPLDVIRGFQAALASPSRELRRALDRFDPQRRARVFANHFGTVAGLDGRRCIGYRRRAWCAVEDKVRIARSWRRLGLLNQPTAWCRPTPSAVRSAWTRVADGRAIVLSGDSSQGPNGGGLLVRSCADERQLDAALAYLSPRCRMLRVMPLVHGVPASVHGLVHGRHIAVLDPVEMIVDHDADRGTFHYLGCSNLWEPPPRLAARMKAFATRQAAWLRERCAFRGAFTLDGICTEHEFVPTEVNARLGSTFGLFDPTGRLDVLMRFLSEDGLVQIDLPGLAAEIGTRHAASRRAFWRHPLPAAADVDGSRLRAAVEAAAGTDITLDATPHADHLDVRCSAGPATTRCALTPVVVPCLQAARDRADSP